jgi:hypothetical protein
VGGHPLLQQQHRIQPISLKQDVNNPRKKKKKKQETNNPISQEQ